MDAEQKTFRLMTLQSRLLHGEVLRKRTLAQEFGVSERSIQRDLENLRVYFEQPKPAPGTDLQSGQGRIPIGRRGTVADWPGTPLYLQNPAGKPEYPTAGDGTADPEASRQRGFRGNPPAGGELGAERAVPTISRSATGSR